MGISNIDERGRIVIPKELREKFGLREGMPVHIDPTENGIKVTIIRDQESIKQLRGCIKIRGELDPLKVKEIWQM